MAEETPSHLDPEGWQPASEEMLADLMRKGMTPETIGARATQSCVDPETYARIYNTGFDDCEQQWHEQVRVLVREHGDRVPAAVLARLIPEERQPPIVPGEVIG